MEEYLRQLCDERHHVIDRRFSDVEAEDERLNNKVDACVNAVNGKFTKLMYWIATQTIVIALSLVGSVITILISRGGG